MTTTQTLSRISKGFHAMNLKGHIVLATGSKGRWVVSFDGEVIGDARTVRDAEILAHMHYWNQEDAK